MVAQGQITFSQQNKNREKSSHPSQESKNRALLTLSTVFPLDLFPDEIIIEDDKINIISREFFATEQIYSIPLEEIGDIFVSTVPYLATLTIIDNRYKETPVKIKYLWQDQAKQARKLVLGLILGKKQQIDFSQMTSEEIKKKTSELGEIKE